jgi:hypothetical protein
MIAAAVLSVASMASAAITLSPMSSFGGGDGWLAPNEVPAIALGTANLERGMAYNPVTGNLILVSRDGNRGNPIQSINGSTGAFNANLQQGSGIVTGGTFTTNLVGVADDGAIYVGNLSVSATAPFKVYRWGTEADAAPTVAFNAATGLARTGDSMGVFGSGAGTKIGAAGSNNVTASNFAMLSTADGLSYAHTSYVSVAGTTTTSNDYRLGIAFIDSDTIIGNQGTNGRITTFGASAVVDATIPLGAAQRPLDYIEVAGMKLLAVVDTNSSVVSVLDVSVPTAPVSLASLTTIVGPSVANANGAGAVAWGAVNVIDANTTEVSLYAMNTNNGIQAFKVVIPEPATLGLLAGAGLLALRRRK